MWKLPSPRSSSGSSTRGRPGGVPRRRGLPPALAPRLADRPGALRAVPRDTRHGRLGAARDRAALPARALARRRPVPGRPRRAALGRGGRGHDPPPRRRPLALLRRHDPPRRARARPAPLRHRPEPPARGHDPRGLPAADPRRGPNRRHPGLPHPQLLPLLHPRLARAHPPLLAPDARRADEPRARARRERAAPRPPRRGAHRGPAPRGQRVAGHGRLHERHDPARRRGGARRQGEPGGGPFRGAPDHRAARHPGLRALRRGGPPPLAPPPRGAAPHGPPGAGRGAGGRARPLVPHDGRARGRGAVRPLRVGHHRARHHRHQGDGAGDPRGARRLGGDLRQHPRGDHHPRRALRDPAGERRRPAAARRPGRGGDRGPDLPRGLPRHGPADAGVPDLRRRADRGGHDGRLLRAAPRAATSRSPRSRARQAGWCTWSTTSPSASR